MRRKLRLSEAQKISGAPELIGHGGLHARELPKVYAVTLQYSIFLAVMPLVTIELADCVPLVGCGFESRVLGGHVFFAVSVVEITKEI